MGFFDKIKQGLKKTSDAVNHSLDSVFAAFVKVDDDLLEELEEALILSDVGASTAAKIVAEVEKRAKLRKTTTADELRDLLREVLIDTAGRLHNKANLMNELAKIDRVISRELPDASRETLLVLDATTGQNAVHQAEEFNKAAELTGIILTKLDGTAKGGIVIAISAGLGVPVKLVGVGEGIDDLIDFDRAAFLEAILPPVHENAENNEEQTEEDENAET